MNVPLGCMYVLGVANGMVPEMMYAIDDEEDDDRDEDRDDDDDKEEEGNLLEESIDVELVSDGVIIGSSTKDELNAS